jgi:hypothetical protein
MSFPQHRPGMCSVENSQIDTCDMILQNLRFSFSNDFYVRISLKVGTFVIFKMTVCVTDIYINLT